MKKIVAILIIAVGVSGCASTPYVEYKKSAAAPIRTVALLTIPESRNVAVVNMGSAATALGAIGGAVGGAIEGKIAATRSQKLSDELNEKQLLMGPVMARHLARQLESAGYMVTHLDQKPKLAADGVSDDYSSIATNADAILNVWFGTTGYASPAFSTSYKPWVVVRARLLDAKTKEVLYFRAFMGGLESTAGGMKNVPGCDAPVFNSADALLNDVAAAYQGITSCHALIAESIVSALR